MDNTFEIKISGEKVDPENFSLRELTELLNSFEDSMKSLILKDNPDIVPEKVIIGFIDINPGIIKLKFKAKPISNYAFLDFINFNHIRG